jgi:hypothetical protein
MAGLSPNAVVLLEGRRGISEADAMAARDFGEFLARRFPALRFRSGNAEGADQAFSDGKRNSVFDFIESFLSSSDDLNLRMELPRSFQKDEFLPLLSNSSYQS